MSASIVKLPTAARRQVKQPCNKWSREAKKAMRDAQPVDFDFKFPTVREAEKIAKAIHPMTPERWLLLGLLHVMPADQFARLAHFGGARQSDDSGAAEVGERQRRAEPRRHGRARKARPMMPPRHPATVWEVAIAAATIGLVLFGIAIADLAARVLP